MLDQRRRRPLVRVETPHLLADQPDLHLVLNQQTYFDIPPQIVGEKERRPDSATEDIQSSRSTGQIVQRELRRDWSLVRQQHEPSHDGLVYHRLRR